MKHRQDPDDFFFILDEYRDPLQEMGQTVHDERYEDNIFRDLLIEYERVLTASYERRDFGLDDIRHMVHAMYVDNLSRPSNAKRVAGRGIAVQVTGYNGSNMLCTYCKGPGHVKQDCAILKEKKHQRGLVSGASKPNVHSTRPGKSKQHPEAQGKGLMKGSGVPSMGSLRTTTRIAECNILSN